MTIRNRTAQIKPATRHAMLDQLARIADGIIHERVMHEWAMAVMQMRLRPPRPSWWQRYLGWLK